MLTVARTIHVSLAVVCSLTLFSVARSNYCYNHQNNTYTARFKPTFCRDTCTVTPFFSPDTSTYTYVNLIMSARDTIDIYTPSLKSWKNTCKNNTDCPTKGKCAGCPIDETKREQFPVFPALLNAVHERGVRVRIITNDFNAVACNETIILQDWLALNNIEIRFYTTTTFQHSKFISIDKGAKTAISSVNWSQTSFLNNREAGVILEDCTCSAISFYQSVFEYDWGNGMDYALTRSYSPSEIKIITDTAHMPYTIPNSSVTGGFVTKLIPHANVEIKKAYTSPDSARETLMSFLSEVKHSLNVAIYQVTDDGLCNELLQLYKRGINVTVLVPCFIIPPYNWHKAQQCYKNLTDGGMQGRIQCAYKKFRFSHEKYWIIDGTTVHLSTGNWSPSDFPSGTAWEKVQTSRRSVNRDLEIVLEHPDLVAYFAQVYNADWITGTEWKPSQ